jgi:predicted O-methyltransferase YrrM
LALRDSNPLGEDEWTRILDALMPHTNRHYKTFVTCLRMAKERGAKIFVETGTNRGGLHGCPGDGCSTMVFGRAVQQLNGILYSVDISKDNMRASRESTQAEGSRISYHVSDSVPFLQHFSQPIDVLYLDSYDFSADKEFESQFHHLKEVVMAYQWLHSRSIVMLDDCGMASMGKCRLVDQFLKSVGWRTVLQDYQHIYVRD